METERIFLASKVKFGDHLNQGQIGVAIENFFINRSIKMIFIYFSIETNINFSAVMDILSIIK